MNLKLKISYDFLIQSLWQRLEAPVVLEMFVNNLALGLSSDFWAILGEFHARER